MSDLDARTLLSALALEANLSEIEDYTDLFQSGIIDSFGAIVVLEKISEVTGLPISNFLENMDTVSSIASIQDILDRKKLP